MAPKLHPAFHTRSTIMIGISKRLSLRAMPVIGAVLLAFVVSTACAAEIFVAKGDPAAADKNPGTQAAPLRTIQAAVDAAKPGDTIWIKQGNYEEPITIRKAATEQQPITMSAWADDRVRIGYQPRPLPVAGPWQPVPGTKRFQVKLTEDVPDDFLLLADGKAILTWPEEKAPKDKPNQASYRKSDRVLSFNSGGKNPAELGRCQYGRRPSCLSFLHIEPPARWWTVQKIEFSWVGVGVYFCGDNCTIEDCFFTHCYRGGMFIHGRMETVRRCNFLHCGNAMHASGAGVAHIIEDNLVVDCGLAAEDDILPLDIPGCVPEGYPPTCFKGNCLSMLFMHNIMSENPGGWYADCPGVQSSRVIGNAFWDNPGGGIYNEAMVNDSMTQGNVFYRNGIGSSVATRWNLVDNLFVEGGIFWNNLDLIPMRDGYMLLRRNAFINPPHGYLTGFSSGWGQYAWPEVFRDSVVDRNRIWLAKDGLLIDEGGPNKYKTLDAVRNKLGWELHGQVLPYDKQKTTVAAVVKAMGGRVATFRIPWGKHSGEARPMLASARGSCPWPGAVLSTDTSTVPCYFWRVADGNYDSAPLLGAYATFAYHDHWLAASGADRSGERHGCIWYSDAVGKFPADLEEKTPCRKGHLQERDTKIMYTEGNLWLAMEGLHPEKMLPQGAGYWSPMLGAAAGAKTTVSLKVRTKALVSGPKGSPVVWLLYTNETGQNRSHAFLLGKDDEGVLHHEELTSGDHDWTQIRETVTAPAGAVRMALFFGLRPCQGEVDFDDIELTTANE
jgi:hypothetical protein